LNDILGFLTASTADFLTQTFVPFSVTIAAVDDADAVAAVVLFVVGVLAGPVLVSEDLDDVDGLSLTVMLLLLPGVDEEEAGVVEPFMLFMLLLLWP